MIKLSELDNSEILVVGNDYQLMTKEELIKNIDKFNETPVYTLGIYHAILNARDILNSAIKNEESRNMYEDWSNLIWNDITDEDIEQIQSILNRILKKNPKQNIACYQDKQVEIDI
ncbi:MAG: GTP-binding protein [Clostridium argentinense]|uniref:GTP-binding protein n=1 Tax=Clostridium faecium TaxID=2762223 RepID=A0ABR8YS27_9CLOT|nr:MULTISPECIES: GTP-binding protein [Clostridium]MBD8046674.1 GTP-binding protein [Clostridium faecium]MBS5825032.1 GTP-binding protein [Clostridium argentinense]MDU1350086.1 GTP-binding protein [Clostridium argentinense]